MESEFHGRRFITVGVSTNLLDASWEALLQSFEVALARESAAEQRAAAVPARG